ncbi:MAG TPA: type II secretion system minor pseudopilin GspI [Trinickia sp.]|jgi:general secretion pathway protein I|uniref:type II secretion system minor pseudopilin GspI n=1 Tax=Trinickia sp. TaxID=2571163 RepID=UPI002CF6F9A6|nr:type II secretion system minor pseudopilin GspI [Trinickia sp.]HTI16413.1 type II secretion system minor pseudopilin GspI [Trinickia sp.]
MDRTFRRRASARGFTMIEVLVALAIIAVALTAALRASAMLASNEAGLHRRLLAGWSADNVLTRLYLSREWPEIGSRTFDCSQGNQALSCTRRVSATPNPMFRRIEVMVTVPGEDGVLAQLVTVVPNETTRAL